MRIEQRAKPKGHVISAMEKTDKRRPFGVEVITVVTGAVRPELERGQQTSYKKLLTDVAL